MHTAPKLHAQRPGRALGCVMERTGVVSWPCRRRVTEHTRALAHCVAAPPGHDTSLYRNTAPCCVVEHPAPYHSLYRCPYCDTNAAPSHDTIFVSRHSPLAKPPARAGPYCAHSAPYCGACSIVSWPSPGRIVAHPLSAHACCVTIQSAVL